jgi:predicted component of type VI protein secretion system
MTCARCESDAVVGVLCAPCAGEIAPCTGLLREHVQSREPEGRADAWLVDGFGGAHAVSSAGCQIGRRSDGDVALLHGSVSRDHVELARAADGWQVRDRGSRNGTRVDGRRVQGRAAITTGAMLAVGEVRLWFVDGNRTLAGGAAINATTHAAALDDLRFVLRKEHDELCVLAGGAGGAALHRRDPAAAWSEVNLSPLELQLLRTLCRQAVADADSPSRSRGCVPTKQLARILPFQSEYADEENVRQVVRRLRTALAAVGVRGVVEGVQGRGYFLGWDVSS